MNCKKCDAPIRARSLKCAKCGADVDAAANLPAKNGGSKAVASADKQLQPAAATRRVEPALLVTGGPDKGTEFPITRILTMIGRQDTCDIVLQETVISREHGRIEQTPEGWAYLNLSDNGTWINRKRVDHAMLANGDTIEVGAKTRMKFALREVEVAQVGPVFKRRTRTRQEDESAVVEIDIDADGGKPSSLQAAGKSLMKRKKLMIGLGIYLGLMVLFFGVLFLANSNKQPDRPMGSTVQQLRTREEILPYLNLTFDYQLDSHMAREKTSQGHSYYERRATGDPNYLYLSVKSFSEAQAYAGGNFGEGDYTSFRTFSSAREELATQIWAHYWEAWQLTDVHRKYDEARESYRKILQMLRDPESPTVNPLYEHVQRKMERLPSRRR